MNASEKIQKLLDGKKAVGYETIAVTDAGSSSLTPPVVTDQKQRAYVAYITLVPDATATNLKNCVNFRLDGTDPDATNGLPLGEGGLLVLQGFSQIANFKVIGVEADMTNSLRVQYFKLGNE